MRMSNENLIVILLGSSCVLALFNGIDEIRQRNAAGKEESSASEQIPEFYFNPEPAVTTTEIAVTAISATHYIPEYTVTSTTCTEITTTFESVTTSEFSSNSQSTPTIDEREYLAEVVEHEAGSDWIDRYDKACCVAAIMNRVEQGTWGGSDIYSVLSAPHQFEGFYPGYCTPQQDAYDAVDYYFENKDKFSSYITSWWGDGYRNYFS